MRGRSPNDSQISGRLLVLSPASSPPAGYVLSDSAFCHNQNALFCAVANVVATKAVLLWRAWNVASVGEELKF